ncbi:hypothetical protein H6F93_00365 [Leptolyngbya sp. FACHB-671]|uniref:hypothetical protein n=1 Tax=Leptolyngbya sp. FACHB-671 TaxID=2692812 RepID=UPI001686C168|nr:hypothetical protein [Leptolyngbya sp. FACHB-671]MBD2066005.1 hypothetical protein [Leptolyngbya sp. FACHB-671]
MSIALDGSVEYDLKLNQPMPVQRHPFAVYLSSLGKGLQATICYALNTIAALLTGGESYVFTSDWSKLRYHHTAAVRVALMDKIATAPAVKMLRLCAAS